MKLHYSEWSTHLANSNSPLVFLHGLGGTGQIWRAITAQLENNFYCVAPDQRGHGESLIPSLETTSFHATDYAQDIQELISLLQKGPVHLIGHSMGVRTAFATAHLAPQLVKSIVAVDLGISSQWGGGMGFPLSEFLKKLPEQFPTRKQLQDYVTAECPDDSIARYLIAVSKPLDLKNRDTSPYTFPFQHEALIRTIQSAHKAPMEEWVRETQQNSIPILFLHGKNSRVWSEQDYFRQKEKLAQPGTTFESWENCGHGLPFERRNEFAERVRTWILEDSRL